MKKLRIYLLFLSLTFLTTSQVQASYAPHERLFYFTDTPSGRASLTKNIDKIDVFAPQVYSVNRKLVPYGSLNKNVRDIIGEKPVKVMPLITNDGFKQDIIHNLLASGAAQDRVINFMVAEAIKNKYYGWQFDFEHIKHTDRDQFTSFVKKTSDIFKNHNLALSVAVVVKTDESTTTDRYKDWSGVFDYKALAQHVDFISIMTYDDPDSIGPTASLPFTEKALWYILDEVPPEKISLGIPSYYWSWITHPEPKRVRSGSYTRLMGIKNRVKYTEGFDTDLGVPWISFKERGVNYTVWHENERSFALKESLIAHHQLRGFSMWVLGMEDPKMWEEI